MNKPESETQRIATHKFHCTNMARWKYLRHGQSQNVIRARLGRFCCYFSFHGIPCWIAMYRFRFEFDKRILCVAYVKECTSSVQFEAHHPCTNTLKTISMITLSLQVTISFFYNVCQLFGAAFDLVRSLIITHVYGAKLPLFPYAPWQKKKKTNLNSRKKTLNNSKYKNKFVS